MNVKEIKNEGLAREYEVTLTAEEMANQTETRLMEISKTVRMAGFRPGKVPMQVMRERYGKAVMGEVLEKAVNDSSAKTIQDNKLRPALQPKIEIKSFDEGKDLTYTMSVEIIPDFDVNDVKSIKIERPVADVTDEVIADALGRIAGQNSVSKPIEGKRAAKKGDVLVIDFDGESKGERLPGMKGEGHHLELGSNSFIPGFEDQLIGKKAGEEVKVDVTFPDPYHSEDLAGQPGTFDVKIHAIHENSPAEVNDDLAKKLGFDTLDPLKEAVKAQIENEFSGFSRERAKRELLDALDNGHDFELPQSLVDMEFETIQKQVAAEEKRDLEKDEIAELKEIAIRRVRLGLVLADIGNENNITVSDQDLNQAVIREAQKYPGQEAQVFEAYRNNEQLINALRAPVFEEKVVDFLLELVDIKDVTVTAEELVNEDHDHEHDKPKKKAATKKPAAKKASAKKATSKADAAEKPAAKKKAPAKKPAAKKAPAKKKAADSKK